MIKMRKGRAGKSSNIFRFRSAVEGFRAEERLYDLSSALKTGVPEEDMRVLGFEDEDIRAAQGIISMSSSLPRAFLFLREYEEGES